MINHTIDDNKIKDISNILTKTQNYLTTKYYEVDDFVHCILISLISKTNMIALGQPGVAKSAVLREIVDIIDFEDLAGTKYFHIQMGADISPNNVFGAPDIDYFKSNGIIKRHYEGFLPDAIIAFCSEFYRVSDQVANSGLLTLLNEGEFKNGTDTVKAKLRFFMADTNFFPKQLDDLEADENDFRLQALHDRFLSRVVVKPLSDDYNKIRMIMMDDYKTFNTKIPIKDIIYVQDILNLIQIPEHIAMDMVAISNALETEYNVFISPRRLKLSRNMIKANAILNGRTKCMPEDLTALKYTFWQKEEDIPVVERLIFDRLNLPQKDADEYDKILNSITKEMNTNIESHQHFKDFNIYDIYKQALDDIMRLMEKINIEYPQRGIYADIDNIYEKVNTEHKRVLNNIIEN